MGGPQGEVLSPFLWNILIDDVLRLSFDFPSTIIAYADDLAVVVSSKSADVATSNLQLVCDSVSSFLTEIKLSLNASKTVMVPFHRRRT